MIVWHMTTDDEATDLGLFGSLQKAKDAYTAELEDDAVDVVWAEWKDGTWKGSINGQVTVEILRRKVH